jgi:hypothetical protein
MPVVPTLLTRFLFLLGTQTPKNFPQTLPGRVTLHIKVIQKHPMLQCKLNNVLPMESSTSHMLMSQGNIIPLTLITAAHLQQPVATDAVIMHSGKAMPCSHQISSL